MNRTIIAIIAAAAVAALSACSSGNVTVGLVSDVDPNWQPHRGPPGAQDLTPEQARWINRVQAAPAGR